MKQTENMVWVDMQGLAQSLYSIDPKTWAAAGYIFRRMNPYTNIVIGSQVEISKQMGVSRQSVAKSLKLLEEKNLIKKIGSKIWFVNPENYFVGDPEDRDDLIREYNET